MTNNEKPKWVLFALIGLLIAPVIFIIGLVFGINVNGSVSLSTDTMSSWISAISTVFIAILTFVLAKETWHLRLAQDKQINELRKESIRPNLEFYLLSASASFQLINIHIENNGKGVANNISFSFCGDNGSLLSENEKSVVKKFNSLNILKNGMRALGANKQRSSFIFSFLDLAEKMGEDTFEIKIQVTIKYEDSEGNAYDSVSIVDFSEFKGITEIGGGDPAYNLYQETKKIREIFQSAQGGISSKRININSFSSDDRKEEIKVTKENIDKHRNTECN